MVKKAWNKKRLLYTTLYYIGLIVAVGSAMYIGMYYYELYQSDKQVERIQEIVKTPTSETSEETEETVEDTIDIAALQEVNADAVGWIQIENTKVDYPVVQGSDNEYYLYHNIFKKYDRQGSVFMDYRNTWDDDNLVLYAHNMKNGNMFADVAKYRNFEYRDAHPALKLIREDEIMEFEVIGAFFYNTKKDTFLYNQPNFDDTQWQEYVNFVSKRNIYGDIKLSHDDQLLTLSTCNYDSKGDRFVLILRRKKMM